MYKTKRVYSLLAAIALVCTACSSTPKVPAEKPLIRSILMVPALDPVIAVTGRKMGTHTLLYALSPIGGVAARQIEIGRNAGDSAAVMRALADSRLMLATEMTQQIVAELKQRSYTVEMMPKEFLGPPDDPLDIKYEKLKGLADALLIVRLEKTTVHSYTTSAGYEPTLNAVVYLVDLNTEDYLFEGDYYYGLDAKTGKKNQFPSEKECIFKDLDQVTNNGPTLAACFRSGAQLIAKSASEGLLTSIR